MAQRTGAERFIAPRCKVASAGGILALATAALLAVSGCGGDSADETASTPAAQSAAESAQRGETPAQSAASSPSDGPGSAAGAAPGAAGGKQGPRPVVPKGPPEQAPSSAEEAQSTLASITLTSPAIPTSEGALPAPYTCEGKDSPPPLRWQGVPPDTAELLLLAMSSVPVGGEVFFDWALAGIDPGLEGLEAAELPKGTVQGRNSFGKVGYSICPPPGGAETYFFVLYALPKALSPAKGFDPLAVREAALQIAGNAGILTTSYARG